MMNNNFYTYQPESYINNSIHEQANIKSNWSYRRYIQENANNIMKFNSMEAINASGNNPYTLYNNTNGPNVPFIYNNIYDNRQSIYDTNYSDLKSEYLHKERQKLKLAPFMLNNKF
jgi:hypothetical protein